MPNTCVTRLPDSIKSSTSRMRIAPWRSPTSKKRRVIMASILRRRRGTISAFIRNVIGRKLSRKALRPASARLEVLINMATHEDLTKGYSRQEREEQIAAVHHLSRKTQKNYLLRPKSLIDALAKPEPASAAEIRALVEFEYSSPVTSLYL